MPVCSSSTSMMTSSIGSSELAGVVALHQHVRPRDGELEALAPHGLDQDAELQLAAAGDLHESLSRRFA